jgi:signal transduction histidine kinase
MTTAEQRQLEIERWIAWIRLGAIPFAIFQVALSSGYPGGYRTAAWLTTALFGVGAILLFLVARRDLAGRALAGLGLVAMTFDFAVISAYMVIYSFERGTPIRQLIFLAIVEAALRYGLVGALALAFASAPVLIAFEWLRQHHSPPHTFKVNFVTFQFGVEVMTALIVGWLVLRMRGGRAEAEARAGEAEELRDQLGRRVDLLEAANRCARALSSSLELGQAFGAFIRELRGLVAFDRVTIVLVEGGRAEVMAAAGRGTDAVFPPGSARPVKGSVLEEVLEGKLVYRPVMEATRYPEEKDLLALGLQSRVLAPLQIGPRSIGMLGLVRVEPDGFSPEDVELIALLGRLVATAIQNIRNYEAEREAADELRRLSALRADFVSVVSHELRSPMAAVIGAARTLQGRWRELTPDQRQSFLALIGDETSRLADLVGDVLDTSRIEAGTFSFSFSDVDLAALVRDVAAAAELGQDEVRVTTEVGPALPSVRGDRERLRQVIQNLVENAVKYSSAGGEVRLVATAHNGRIRVDVQDEGPGIPLEDQKLIFEKFGRSDAGGGAKPGTGLGLFIARSIVEAHGGSLEVDSAPKEGSVFTLELPIDRSA